MKITLTASIVMMIIGLTIAIGSIIEVINTPIGEPVDFIVFIGFVLMVACFHVSAVLLKQYLEYA